MGSSYNVLSMEFEVEIGTERVDHVIARFPWRHTRLNSGEHVQGGRSRGRQGICCCRATPHSRAAATEQNI